MRAEVLKAVLEVVGKAAGWQRSHRAWLEATEYRRGVIERPRSRASRATEGSSQERPSAQKRRNCIRTTTDGVRVARSVRALSSLQIALEARAQVLATADARLQLAERELTRASDELLACGRLGAALAGTSETELRHFAYGASGSSIRRLGRKAGGDAP